MKIKKYLAILSTLLVILCFFILGSSGEKLLVYLSYLPHSNYTHFYNLKVPVPQGWFLKKKGSKMYLMYAPDYPKGISITQNVLTEKDLLNNYVNMIEQDSSLYFEGSKDLLIDGQILKGIVLGSNQNKRAIEYYTLPDNQIIISLEYDPKYKEKYMAIIENIVFLGKGERDSGLALE